VKWVFSTHQYRDPVKEDGGDGLAHHNHKST